MPQADLGKCYNTNMNPDIITFNQQLPEDRQAICELLASEIIKGLPNATNKLWHGSPVWFLNENPIVGYASLKDSVQLLFWSGQSFDEPGLQAEGSFKAAQARYKTVGEIDVSALQRWLKKAESIQWDYKNIVKRKGRLERL